MASEAKGLAETPAEEVTGRRGIKKGLYLLPSAFTAANVGMGYFAVMAALRGFQMLDGVAPGEPLEGLAAQKVRSEEHTSELQSRQYLVCRLLLEKKKETDAMLLDHVQISVTT